MYLSARDKLFLVAYLTKTAGKGINLCIHNYKRMEILKTAFTRFFNDGTLNAQEQPAIY